MSFISDNIQKILGSVTALQGVILTMIASGTFNGLLDDSTIRWLGITMTLTGAAVTGAGFVTTAKVRMADAMKTAINATPGEKTDA